MALIAGIFLLYEPIKTLSRMHILMQRSIQATVEIFRILDSKPSVKDRADAIALPQSRGLLEFDHVTFRYFGGVQDAVKNLNLRIEPGKSYALVGASGAGKSTMLSLILRLYDPTKGVVRIDGRDLRSITQKSLREQIGLVSQETFLFHDTIFTNIQFGRLNATEEEVYAAAKTAYAHDFIMAQPKGYETVIGDKGCLLSGGQQQRLAIARALLKNAPILLLDEATSALDSESEQQIQLALERLAQGRTVIAIAHRLSTILSADQIVVMDSGNIKEIGTHRGAAYWRIRATTAVSTTSNSTAIRKSPARKVTGNTGFQPVMSRGLPARRVRTTQARRPHDATGWKPVLRLLPCRNDRREGSSTTQGKRSSVQIATAGE